MWENDFSEQEITKALSTVPESYMNALYRQTIQIMGRMVDYKELRMIYACAIKEVKTKFDILNTEFNLQYHRNPINSIQSRLKSTASIISKISSMNMEPTIENIDNNIHDIAGIRVICSYVDDVFKIADALLKQDDITLIAKKDYITTPKPNGYRSLHLIITVPVFLSERRVDRKVEVQIRTVAMDFWASLEHQLHYKQNLDAKELLVDDLKECAQSINEIDLKMMALRTKMESIADIPTQEQILFEKFSKIDFPIE